jgi:TolB-like protein/DNA-binding winged helix-turn-helix (wHTH) protein/Tfp pilus assembly protein PilF
VLDPESGDLERGGMRIRLQEQPVQVLRELIAHAGSVVPREQLIALLWPKGVVDFDTGLNTVIRKLRSALGDTSETPRYIETLPRRGYRFIGALDPDPEAISAASAAVPVSAASGVSPASVPPSHHEPTVLPEAALAEPKSMASGREPAAREVTSSTATTTASVLRPRLSARGLIAAFAVVALLAGVYALWRARSGASVTSVRVEAPSQARLPANVAPTSAIAFSPPPHFVAVLPFVNMSGDPSQEYFSDGLAEELLNSLSRIDGLQVVGRTSSFYFKGKDVDLGTVGHKLNVAAVLEGSVRRSAHTVRVTARLTSAVTGFQLWSETYDRDLGDILRLQSEIANAVAPALKVTLLGNVAAKGESGGTRNPAAFDAYLRASRIYWSSSGSEGVQEAITGYTHAVRLDPTFALAYAARSNALDVLALFNLGASMRLNLDEAQADAYKAAELAPGLAESHLALAWAFEAASLDFVRAEREYERAMELAPGSARMARNYGRYAALIGHTDSAITAARRAVALDPLSLQTHQMLAQVLYLAGRHDDAIAANDDALALNPDDPYTHANRGLAFYALGNFESARSSCEIKIDHMRTQLCLSIAYDKLGRNSDAEAQVAKLRASAKDAGAYQYAEIKAQWGKPAQALEWLDTAVRLRSAWLVWVKKDPLLDPLRNEPRYQAIVRALKFPD